MWERGRREGRACKGVRETKCIHNVCETLLKFDDLLTLL